MKFISEVISTTIVVILLVLIVFTPKCHHEQYREVYTIYSPESTQLGYVKRFCKNCDYYLGRTDFKGLPKDSSYLEVIREHSDGDEIVDGEYYTINAIVSFGYYYRSTRSVQCRVENENITVGFSVSFREGFDDILSTVEEGDEITFRGKFVGASCDWTDCELLKK